MNQIRQLIALILTLIVMGFPQISAAQISPAEIGVVVMHGKGGSPTKLVSDLASSLEGKGYLVANLEMPWSKRRDYDVSVCIAEKEIESALDILRSKGAKKLFVAGHSQGGVFALYFGSRHPALAGVIAIAPGGNAASATFREKLGTSVELARKFVAEGKGNEKATFSDYEGSKGTNPVITTAAIYFGWFDPDGAMNQMKALQAMSSETPVLFIAPTQDYPALFRARQGMFEALPKNTLSKLYEPDATHIYAPSASRDEIARWIVEVAAGWKR